MLRFTSGDSWRSRSNGPPGVALRAKKDSVATAHRTSSAPTRRLATNLIIVVDPPRVGAALRVARRRLAPGSLPPAPPLGGAWRKPHVPERLIGGGGYREPPHVPADPPVLGGHLERGNPGVGEPPVLDS